MDYITSGNHQGASINVKCYKKYEKFIPFGDEDEFIVHLFRCVGAPARNCGCCFEIRILRNSYNGIN